MLFNIFSVYDFQICVHIIQREHIQNPRAGIIDSQIVRFSGKIVTYVLANRVRTSNIHILRYMDVEFEDLITVIINNSIFWDTKLCSPLKVKRHFGGTCRLHLHTWTSQARNQNSACCLLHADFFDPEGKGDLFLRNVGWLPMDDTSIYPRRLISSRYL
jgi:hypothetical protein